jgi:hypothetical protein
MRTPDLTAVRALILVTLLLSGVTQADGQVRRGRPVPTAPGWAPIAVGVHVGYDQRSQAELIGAHIRIPVLRGGTVEIVPNAHIVFLNNNKEYQYNLDAVYVFGDARGSVFAGGGIGRRDTVLGAPTGTPRATVSSYSIVFGAKSGGTGFLTTQIEGRWIFLDDSDFRPLAFTLGLNFSLWRQRPGT